jgi:phage-related protein
VSVARTASAPRDVDAIYENTYSRINGEYRHPSAGDMGRVGARGSQEVSAAGAPGCRQALYAAQRGETDPAAKPLRGFGGAHVVEIVDRHDTNTYRAVYTAQFDDAIYVLHAFQKKSKSGIATPKREIDLIRRRLAEAERLHRERQH